MSDQIQCFFAFPSAVPALVETVENAIEQVNCQADDRVSAKSWRYLKIGGKPLISTICKAIDQCQVFVCDLTYLNPNVLFELGYAVAVNRRVWIALDHTYPSAVANYKKLKPLTTLGYASYSNAQELAAAFLWERPFDDLDSTILRSIQETVQPGRRPPVLFYLKSEVATEASNQLSRRLASAKIPLTTDDPRENNSQTLAWYAQNTSSACGVVAHLLDETRASGSLRNAKYSFVCGMAYGFRKPVRMLAHAPFEVPLDYMDLLYVHSTGAECVQAIERWLPAVSKSYAQLQQQYTSLETEDRHVAELRRASLGEEIAENEQRALLDYFIETAAYLEALKTPLSMVYVGRKGSGKTANLYKIADELVKRNPHNHVCVIKPVSYEVEGIVELLRRTRERAVQGYLTESIWKFLIYTELAVSVCEEIRSKPPHYQVSPDEEALLSYVEAHSAVIQPEFTVRLEQAIKDLCSIEGGESIGERRSRISEKLHEGILSTLRETLGKVLAKRPCVCILMDNLDKAWVRGGDLPLLAEFLFGLLSVSRAITDEFRKRGTVTWRPVNLSLLVFLRSDIFSYIVAEAREKDKLAYRRLDWTDPALLVRVIEERLLESVERTMRPEEIWDKFFVANIDGIPTSQYLTTRVVPRPRDIIYLCKTALAHAVNHRHTKIESEDIVLAEGDYSQHAFSSLEVETTTQMDHCEELLYEFVGAEEIVTRRQIGEFACKARVHADQLSQAIQLLCESSFLGLEVDLNQFEFIDADERGKVAWARARKTTEKHGTERYRIHPAFHAYLEIRPQAAHHQNEH